MELTGALSNPQPLLEGSGVRISELKGRLERTGDQRDVRPPALRPRAGRVARAVVEVLGAADRPLRVVEIHQACEAYLGERTSASTVKDCLSAHPRGSNPRFVRVSLGTYRLAATLPAS